MKHSILSQTPQSLKLRFQLSPEEARLANSDSLSPTERQQQVTQTATARYLQAQAIKDLKISMFLRAVAQRESLNLSGPELETRFQTLAPDQPIKDIVARLTDRPEMPVILGACLSEKVMNWLVSRAELSSQGLVLQNF